jgi:formylglycine-generating enzyme required for sulfatase activity
MVDSLPPLLRVFICHAWEDKKIVRQLYRRLKSESWLDPWLDEEKLLPGQDFRERIEEAVESSDIVIICLSNNSVNKDGFIQRELKYAKDIALEKTEETIFLIPIRFEDCNVPRGLKHYHWVDYFGKRKDEGYFSLLKSLRVKHAQLFSNQTSEDKKAGREAPRNRGDFFHGLFEVFRSGIEAVKKAIITFISELSFLCKRIIAFSQENLKWILYFLAICSLATAIYVLGKLRPLEIPLITAPTLTSTNPPTMTQSISPTSTATKEPTATPLIVTATITVLPTITSTFTPLPESISDLKNVEMVLIPEGPFIMGYDEGTAAEDPQGKRSVDAFYIDRHEVTNEFYSKCVENGICQPPHTNSSNTHPNYYGDLKYSNYPVINIDWYQAVTYCEWRDARLPTEPEWEKAARGIDGKLYPWGSKESCSYTNSYNCIGDTSPVGSYESGKSVYGVYDMAGNVKEWVSSLFVEYPYRTNDGRENLAGERARVFRGGAWNSHTIIEIRTSYRSGTAPSSFSTSLGFRCARSIPEVEILESVLGKVNTDKLLNCRLEPNLNSQIIDFLKPDDSFTILSRLADNSWLLVKAPGIESCWVSTPLITVSSGSLNDLQINTIHPTSTPSP